MLTFDVSAAWGRLGDGDVRWALVARGDVLASGASAAGGANETQRVRAAVCRGARARVTIDRFRHSALIIYYDPSK